ncbi:MAG TPA: hypothetical protein DEP00_00435 [Lachnospiraceae bacterium]|nr:hypothetical protein [Lachnospiraceae bacterium]
MKKDYPGVIGRTVSGRIDRPIGSHHPEWPDMFVAFYSGFMDLEPYGTKVYFTDHPQFSKQGCDDLYLPHQLCHVYRPSLPRSCRSLNL